MIYCARDNLYWFITAKVPLIIEFWLVEAIAALKQICMDLIYAIAFLHFPCL
nr:hypothetical protein [Roseofilum reptotaenium]